MTTSLSLAEAKEVVYHNFNLSRLRNYEMYDEDFETFITNVGSTKYFYPADRSFFVHDAMLRFALLWLIFFCQIFVLFPNRK